MTGSNLTHPKQHASSIEQHVFCKVIGCTIGCANSNRPGILQIGFTGTRGFSLSNMVV